MSFHKKIIVEEYNPIWAQEFNKFKNRFENLLKNDIIDVLHVGSTSVVGLASKPIIDIVIIIDEVKFKNVKSKLETSGYYHNGDQGIPGREAFRLPKEINTKWFPHHLYVCLEKADELIRYRAFLKYLGENSEAREEYSIIKFEAAKLHPNDIEGYMDFKGKFIAEHLTIALNLWGYKPPHRGQVCVNCQSTNYQSHFNIKYHEGGMKHEFYTFKCQNCDQRWELQL